MDKGYFPQSRRMLFLAVILTSKVFSFSKIESRLTLYFIVLCTGASARQRELITGLDQIVDTLQVEARSAQEFLQNISKELLKSSAVALKILGPIKEAAESEVKGKPLERHISNLIENIMRWMLDTEKNWEVR